ncbi:hypothetical protein [Candidatus Nitrospira neomarina]|uniref:Uncharacterized protein n=1 Tax=Candidatus Nitrospira neomarina TaxID=3020899 RepID=A0AA96GRJ5_9BACT|nr:hypothetical protein [Candidatus Nitrospira neomarina]WNM63993.1 hypothetical protein PQG83_09615 [Candidatus Nitrospira neomarina]
MRSFTPGYVHQINNQTALWQERQALNQAAQKRRRAYCLQTSRRSQRKKRRERSVMAQGAIVSYWPNMEAVFGGQVTNRPLPSQWEENPLKTTHEII